MACYVLTVRGVQGERLATLGTDREPYTLHGKITPGLHRLCASLLALFAVAACVELACWRVGLDVEQALVILVATRTDEPGSLAYEVVSEPGGAHE